MRTYTFTFDDITGTADVHHDHVFVRWDGAGFQIEACSIDMQTTIWAAIRAERDRCEIPDDTHASTKFDF